MASVTKFRDKFVIPGMREKLTSWFPGHMHKGMKQMQRKLVGIDCIVEVHDARIPFTGRNPMFYSMLTAIRPHILVLNKMDLCDMSYKDEVIKELEKQNIHSVLYTNCKDSARSGVNKILPKAIELMKSEKFQRNFASELMLMVIGIPNVGKSSLINRLRNVQLKKRNANPVGPRPGVTKSVLEKVKISDDPLVYLVDTPGVMQPNIKNLEVGLRLALCCTLNDSLVGEDVIADYLLYWLNKHQNFSYVEYLGIPTTTDDIRILLFETAKKLDMCRTVKDYSGGPPKIIPDYDMAARYFIKAFREGAFGKVLIDDDAFNKTSKS